MRKGSVRHTIQALVGLAMIVLPLLLKLIEKWPSMTCVAMVLGFVVTLLTNPRTVFLLKILLDYWFPEKQADVPGVSGGSTIAEVELRRIEAALDGEKTTDCSGDEVSR